MRPAAELAAVAHEIDGIFTDVDDTLTGEDGAVTPEAFAALAAARRAGLRVAAVTGRPAGWGAVLAASWPIDAAVAENGAVAYWRTPAAPDAVRPGIAELFWDDAATRAAHRPRLEAIAEAVLAQVPKARLAGDNWLRLCDLAFDVGETQRLAPDEVEAIADRVRAGGARVMVSSVHAHAYFGAHDKAAMLERLAGALWHEDLQARRDRYLFVGDSLNDQPGFSFFPRSVGVANVARYVDRLAPPPAFVTSLKGGLGFAELVALLLTAKAHTT